MLVRAVRDVVGSDSISAVGISVTGPVDRIGRQVHNPATLADWSGTPWPAQLEQALGVPVVLENDAVGAAIGEAEFGAGRDADVMAMVTLGTGVGVAVVSRSSGAWRGTAGFHPEAGHIPVSLDSELCYCGLQGCWESTSSGAGIRRLWTTRDGQIDWLGYGRALSRGLRAVGRMYAPQVIVIGGGIARNYNDFITPVLEHFAGNDPMGPANAPTIACAELEHSAIFGAATIARRQKTPPQPDPAHPGGWFRAAGVSTKKRS